MPDGAFDDINDPVHDFLAVQGPADPQISRGYGLSSLSGYQSL